MKERKGSVYLEFDQTIVSNVQKQISPSDLFHKGILGLFDNIHIPLVSGIIKEYDESVVFQRALVKNMRPIELKSLSIIKYTNYEILKLTAFTESVYDNWLINSNARLSTLAPTKFYFTPHAPIAYLILGRGNNYKMLCDEMSETITPNKLVYIKPSGKKCEVNLSI